jgi:Cupredoxin-like domain
MSIARPLPLFALAAGLALGPAALAEDPVSVTVTLKDHKFSPAEPTAPAGRSILLQVINQDGTPAEFESKALRVEKSVVGGGAIKINLLPLKPGRYRFFDDYNEETTVGFLVIR